MKTVPNREDRQIMYKSKFMMQNFLDDKRYPPLDSTLHITFELLQRWNADLLRNSIGCRWLHFFILQRMNPIPKIMVMQILVYKGFILVVFSRLFWVLLFYLVSLRGINVISVEVFASLAYCFLSKHSEILFCISNCARVVEKTHLNTQRLNSSPFLSTFMHQIKQTNCRFDLIQQNKNKMWRLHRQQINFSQQYLR